MTENRETRTRAELEFLAAFRAAGPLNGIVDDQGNVNHEAMAACARLSTACEAMAKEIESGFPCP